MPERSMRTSLSVRHVHIFVVYQVHFDARCVTQGHRRWYPSCPGVFHASASPSQRELRQNKQNNPNIKNPTVYLEVAITPNPLACVNFDAEAAQLYFLEIELFEDTTPETAYRFEKHCIRGDWTGCDFFRIIPGFMMQGGDTLANNGRGGVVALGSVWVAVFRRGVELVRRFSVVVGGGVLRCRERLLRMSNFAPWDQGTKNWIRRHRV